MFKKILVPLDGSETSENSLPYAQELAMRYGAQMILLRVVKPVEITDSYTSSYMLIKEAEEIALKFAKEYLEGLEKGIRNEGIEVQSEVSQGTPYREILKYADKNNVDLIVMTARGRTGLTKWLMGSVASKVLKGANVPILLVRAIKH